MADVGWIKLATAALGGGITVKLLDIAYQEFRQRSERKRTAHQFLEENLDPVLKAADELFGKIRSLSARDFKGLRSASEELDKGALRIGDLSGLMYLFAKFWARVEAIREESLYLPLARDGRGWQLLEFLRCLEAQRVRVVDRTAQRAIGEILLERRAGRFEVVPFVGFVEAFEKEEKARRWLSPLATVLARTHHVRERQLILKYGVVLQAMMDTLDPKHHGTRNRPPYPAKLTKRSQRELHYRVFGAHLGFVRNSEKYTQKK